jgi:abhydrolase domain-containing protein 8
MINKVIEIRPGRSINVNLYSHPTSKATAFLIHGLGGSSAQWREQINLLKEHYSLVIPDLFGHGESAKPKSNQGNPYSYPELEQDLQALFKKMATEKNILMGHSYGGALAVGLAIDHQDKIDHLVLISPTACTPNIPIPIIYRLPAFLMEWFRPVLEKHFLQLAFMSTDDPALIETELMAGRKNPMYVVRALINGMKQTTKLDITMLTIPTLLLLGKLDHLIPAEHSEQFYRAIPNHQCVLFDDAAHMVMLEQPARTNQLIMNFLNS